MLIHPYHDELDRRHRREQRESLRRERLAARGGRGRSFRRVVGRSMIRIGSRLAAEPARQRARLA
jgi:hypothetical protein